MAHVGGSRTALERVGADDGLQIASGEPRRRDRRGHDRERDLLRIVRGIERELVAGVNAARGDAHDDEGDHEVATRTHPEWLAVTVGDGRPTGGRSARPPVRSGEVPYAVTWGQVSSIHL